MATRFVGRDRLHLAFNFDFLRQPWLPRTALQSIRRYHAALPADAWPCWVLGNHDVDRFPTRHGGGPYADARTKVAATLLLTLRGTPFIYYGEELGMQNAYIPPDEIQDPPGRRYWPFYGGRDPERTPMQWEGGPNAGFTSGAPWLRVHDDFADRNVAAQDADPESVLNFYRRLLELRRGSAALRAGAFQPLVKRPVEALAYLRQSPGQSILVALNFFGWDVALTLDEPPATHHWRLLLSSLPGEHRRAQDGRLALGPFEACLLEAEADY
jgi:alpha-glucosidase